MLWCDAVGVIRKVAKVRSNVDRDEISLCRRKTKSCLLLFILFVLKSIEENSFQVSGKRRRVFNHTQSSAPQPSMSCNVKYTHSRTLMARAWSITCRCVSPLPFCFVEKPQRFTKYFVAVSILQWEVFSVRHQNIQQFMVIRI